MIDIEQSELAPVIMGELKQRLQRLIDRHGFTAGLLQEMSTLFVDTRQRCRNQGIDFPVMTALVLPSIRTFEIVRSDLNSKAIRTIILNVITKYPGVDTMELASAVHAAYPHHLPGSRY